MRPPGGGATGCIQGHTTPSYGLPQVSTRSVRPPARQPPEPALGPGTVLPIGLARQVAGHQTDEAPRPQVCGRHRAGLRPPLPAGRPRGPTPPWPGRHGCRLTLGVAPGLGLQPAGGHHVSQGPQVLRGHPRPSGPESARFPFTCLCAVTCSYPYLVFTSQGAGDTWPQRAWYMALPRTWGNHRPFPPWCALHWSHTVGGRSWGPDPQWVVWGPRQAFLTPCGHVHRGPCPHCGLCWPAPAWPSPGQDHPRPWPPELLSQIFSHS